MGGFHLIYQNHDFLTSKVRGLKKNNETIKNHLLAPVEHFLFSNHEYCDEQWCYVLKAQKEGKPYVPEESRPFSNKNDDNKTYNQLKEAVA